IMSFVYVPGDTSFSGLHEPATAEERGAPEAGSVSFLPLYLPFYQFTQPCVATSPCSGNSLDFCDSFSVRFLRGQGPQNATHGDQDSSPGAPLNARAGDP